MTRRSAEATAPRLLLRAGAVAGLALGLLVAASACAPTPDGVAAEIEAVYTQASGLDGEAAELRQLRDAAILDWASERGILAEDFSMTSLVDDLEKEQTETTYGPRDARLWSSYQDHIEEHAQAIRDEIRDEQSLDDVRAFYAEHPGRFEQQDDVTIDVTEWEDGRATTTRSIEITATNVRELQEQDDEMFSVALDLAEGEQATVERGDGRFVQISCVSRKDAGLMPFDDVVQAAAGQLAAQIFETELDERIAD